MDENLHEEFVDLKMDVNTSLNYYGALWTRSRYWLWASRFVDFLAASLAGYAFAIDKSWSCWIAVGIAALSWLKTESFIDRRVGVLARQYQQTNRLVREFPGEDKEDRDAYVHLRERMASIEEGDLPTIQCLWMACENESRYKYGIPGRWELSWWQRHIGIYFRSVRCDGNVPLVNSSIIDGEANQNIGRARVDET